MVTDQSTESASPPVGLNWDVVSRQIGLDRRLLQHDGNIVLAGEYFPEAGYAFDPATLQARFVDVGEIALRHVYFLGELALRNVRSHIPVPQETAQITHPIIPSPPTGPMIGLFAEEVAANRAKQRILHGSVGSGVTAEVGPLGYELWVARPHSGGMVATIIAGQGGAIISIGGVPVTQLTESSGPSSTGPSIVGEQAPAPRPGTGVASDVQVPAEEAGGSEELRPL